MVEGDSVSVITPTYNAQKFVAQAIASVRAQTYSDWEMIIVDDCSSDDTAKIVARYAIGDSRLHLVSGSMRQGPALARNAALELARGRFIAFLDSDDWWLPNKLSRQLEFMRKTGAALSYTQFRRVSQDGSIEGRLITIPEVVRYDHLLRNTAIATSTAIIDRQQTGDFRMIPTFYDDFALWLKLLKQGFSAHGLREDLMRYRVVGNSFSRRKGQSARKVWQTYREVERLNLIYATWCFTGYALNALRKYHRF